MLLSQKMLGVADAENISDTQHDENHELESSQERQRRSPIAISIEQGRLDAHARAELAAQHEEARAYELIKVVDRSREPLVRQWVVKQRSLLFPWQRLLSYNSERARACSALYEVGDELDRSDQEERVGLLFSAAAATSATSRSAGVSALLTPVPSLLRSPAQVASLGLGNFSAGFAAVPAEAIAIASERSPLGQSLPPAGETYGDLIDSARVVFERMLFDVVDPAAGAEIVGKDLKDELSQLQQHIPLRISPLFFKLLFASLYNLFLNESKNRPNGDVSQESRFPLCMQMARLDWIEAISAHPLAFDRFNSTPIPALNNVLIPFFVTMVLSSGEFPAHHQTLVDVDPSTAQWKRARAHFELSFALFLSVVRTVVETMKIHNMSSRTMTVFGMSKELMREDGNTPELADTFNELRAMFHPSYKVAIESKPRISVPQVPSPAVAKFIHAGKLRTIWSIRQRKRQFRQINDRLCRCEEADERRSELHRYGGKLPPTDLVEAALHPMSVPTTKLSPLLSRDRSDMWIIQLDGSRVINPHYKEHRAPHFFDIVAQKAKSNAHVDGGVSRRDKELYIRPRQLPLEEVFRFRLQEIARAEDLNVAEHDDGAVVLPPNSGRVPTAAVAREATATIVGASQLTVSGVNSSPLKTRQPTAETHSWSPAAGRNYPKLDASGVTVEEILRIGDDWSQQRECRSQQGRGDFARPSSSMRQVSTVESRAREKFERAQQAFGEQHRSFVTDFTTQRPRSSLEVLKTREEAILGSTIEKRSQALQNFNNFLKTTKPFGTKGPSAVRQEKVERRKATAVLTQLPPHLRIYCY